MKKIFTLLVSVTLFASAFAQYNNGGNKDFGKSRDAVYSDRYNNDHDRGGNSYSFSAKERDMQIAQINREYDRKVMEVRNRWFMSRFKKEQLIHRLNEERNDEIKRVYSKYSMGNRYDDHHWGRH